VRALSSASANAGLAAKPTLVTEGATAFKRDYEERARELTQEALEDEASAASALFTDETAEADAEAKKLASQRRQQSLMQGYTGNECSECHNFTMVRNGTCEKCDTCGSTSGCS
jgi:ribonucleoside-diphosphate reductase alpha chain